MLHGRVDELLTMITIAMVTTMKRTSQPGGAKRSFAMCSSFCRSALPQDQVITSHHHHHHQNHHNCLFQICWFGINMKWSSTFEMLLSLPYLSFFVVFFNFPQILQRLSEPQEGGREAWPPGICLIIYLFMSTFQYLLICWNEMKTIHGLWTYHWLRHINSELSLLLDLSRCVVGSSSSPEKGMLRSSSTRWGDSC